MLLLASCLFYMAFIPKYIFILFITIAIDYVAGIYIEKSSGKRKRVWLWTSIISTCLVLFIFKYFNFFGTNFDAIARILHWNYSIGVLKLILPIGLSFHTFQSLSYVIEVYRGQQKAEHNFWIYSLYVMFYPQLVAGPIERPQNLLHQFYERHNFDYTNAVSGLRRMLFGLFKKVVIADNAAVMVNFVYSDPHNFGGIPLLIATVLFAFQIYCDFSGYSDIAIGSAQVMGFRLRENFDRPYFSKSISEFWKRWHMSLSSWFKDYVYIPLGGSRVLPARHFFNLFLTFTLSGLWHGANWTYVIWGALNGFYLMGSLLTARIRQTLSVSLKLERFPGLQTGIQRLSTFSLICFSWIFFRADSLADAFYIATHLFTGFGSYVKNILIPGIFNGLDFLTAKTFLGIDLGVPFRTFAFTVLMIILMELIQRASRRDNLGELASTQPLWLRWSIYYLVAGSIIFFLNSMPSINFIYFQF